MAQCSEGLLQGWNKTYADPLPMETGLRMARPDWLTSWLPFPSLISRKQISSGDPLACHVCTAPDSHYGTPEVTFPVKTALSVLKKVLDAAGGKFLPQPTLLIGRSPKARAGISSRRKMWFGCSLLESWGGRQQAVVRQNLGNEMVAEGMKMGSETCVAFLAANDMLLHTFRCNETITCPCVFLQAIMCHYTTCNYKWLHAITCICNYMQLHAVTCNYMQLQINLIM